VGQAGNKFLKMMEPQVKKRVNPSAADFKMKKAHLGNDAGFIGAAILGQDLRTNPPHH